MKNRLVAMLVALGSVVALCLGLVGLASPASASTWDNPSAPCGTVTEGSGRTVFNAPQDWPSDLRPLAYSSASSTATSNRYVFTADGGVLKFVQRFDVTAGSAGNGLPVRISTLWEDATNDSEGYVVRSEKFEWWAPVLGNCAGPWKHYTVKGSLDHARDLGFPA